jgi:citrate lyase subunit beta/citryl-CoA lyase
MSLASRPRRSALYMPASNARAVEKAKGLDCDVVILDLEDAVLPEAKPAAREAAVAAVRAGGFGGREVVVRVNALSTPWGEADLREIAEAGPDAVLVPKIASAADVEACDAAWPPGRDPAVGRDETCPAIFALSDIAGAASGRGSQPLSGINDSASGARMPADGGPFRPPPAWSGRARRAGLAIPDGVHNEIDDLAALTRCAARAWFWLRRQDVIHPSQIEICNRPSPEAGEVAQRGR